MFQLTVNGNHSADVWLWQQQQSTKDHDLGRGQQQQQQLRLQLQLLLLLSAQVELFSAQNNRRQVGLDLRQQCRWQHYWQCCDPSPPAEIWVKLWAVHIGSTNRQ
jgi:hypothetical protein